MGNLLSKPNTEYKAHHIFSKHNADGGLKLKRGRYKKLEVAVHTKEHYRRILENYEKVKEDYKLCQCNFCTYDMKLVTKTAMLASMFVNSE